MVRWIEGIVIKDGYVLIGKLRKRNLLIPRLIWTFPFVEAKEDESPRKLIKDYFEKDLGMKVKVNKFLLKYVPSENSNVEQYFYELKHMSGNVITSKDYYEFAWVKPTQVLRYFTTSISKDLMDYLRFLEKSGKGIIIN
jgi:hypothetical protein